MTLIGLLCANSQSLNTKPKTLNKFLFYPYSSKNALWCEGRLMLLRRPSDYVASAIATLFVKTWIILPFFTKNIGK